MFIQRKKKKNFGKLCHYEIHVQRLIQVITSILVIKKNSFSSLVTTDTSKMQLESVLEIMLSSLKSAEMEM